MSFSIVRTSVLAAVLSGGAFVAGCHSDMGEKQSAPEKADQSAKTPTLAPGVDAIATTQPGMNTPEATTQQMKENGDTSAKDPTLTPTTP